MATARTAAETAATAHHMWAWHRIRAQEGGGAWQPPAMQRPALCDSLEPHNAAFLKYDNHPCTFLSWPDAPAAAQLQTVGEAALQQAQAPILHV